MADRNQPILQLNAPGFGKDTLAYEAGKLHAVELHAQEGISTPYHLQITADTTHRTISPAELVLKPVSLNVRRSADQQRFFHGIVRELTPLGYSWRDRFRYRLTVVPRLWFLDQITDCRIYQNKTAQQILTLIFGEFDVGATSFRINGSLPVREYTTQYNETYLRFACRIMQESGLFYFFEHSENDHVLVVTNHNQAFKTISGPKHRVTEDHRMEEEPVQDWRLSVRTVPGKFETQSFDLQKPDVPLTGQEASHTTSSILSKGWTTYSWPGFGNKTDILRDHARIRMQAEEAAASFRSGSATNPNLYPGGIITLLEDPLTAESDMRCVVASTGHHVIDETWIPGRPPPSWSTHFECFAERDSWRDEVVLARPSMNGVYSALVIGDDQEIETDRYGRIKVRPLFDHRQEVKASEAIWVRVMHAWSGPSAAGAAGGSPQARGWQHVPRIGTEVGLAFMNGDPDDPVVMGCFYNAVAKPPFDLPAERTKQGFRSHSSVTAAGVHKYNELSFDDADGRERVYLRAQKDHDVESMTGNITVTADEGSITVTAATEITLKVGASSIVILPETIQINTPGDLSLKAGGAIQVAALGAVTVSSVADINITTVAVMTVSAPPGEIAITGGNVTITSTETGLVELLEGFV